MGIILFPCRIWLSHSKSELIDHYLVTIYENWVQHYSQTQMVFCNSSPVSLSLNSKIRVATFVRIQLLYLIFKLKLCIIHISVDSCWCLCLKRYSVSNNILWFPCCFLHSWTPRAHYLLNSCKTKELVYCKSKAKTVKFSSTFNLPTTRLSAAS